MDALDKLCGYAANDAPVNFFFNDKAEFSSKFFWEFLL